MHQLLKLTLLGFMYTVTAFDLEDYATTYRATRDAYLKAANELKLATGPYKAARDAYVAATATYTKSLYERRRLGMVDNTKNVLFSTLNSAKNILRKAAGLKARDGWSDQMVDATDATVGMSYGTHGTTQANKAETPPGALVTGGTYRTAGATGNGQDSQYAHLLDYTTAYKGDMNKWEQMYSWYSRRMYSPVGIAITAQTQRGINEVASKVAHCYAKRRLESQKDYYARTTGDSFGASYGTDVDTPQTADMHTLPPGAHVDGGTRRAVNPGADRVSNQYAHIGGIDSFWVPEKLCYEQVGQRAFLRSIESTQLIN